MSTRKQRQEVKELIAGVKRMFFICDWDLQLHFEPVDYNSAIAKVQINEPYQQAILTIFPYYFRIGKVKRIQSIIHEICHIHVSPLSNLVQKLYNGRHITPLEAVETEERVVNRLATIINNLLENSRCKGGQNVKENKAKPNKKTVGKKNKQRDS